MIALDVILTLPDRLQIKCGEIVTTSRDSKGQIRGAFRYTPEYLQHDRAFPLDPGELPLTSNEFETIRPQGIFGVFEDALPDDWGRRLLVRKANLSHREQTEPKLLEVLGNNGMGALSFRSENSDPDSEVSADIAELEALLELSVKYDAGEQLNDEEFNFLAIHGSSPGGARPKTLVQKKDKTLWIAKFPQINDTFRVEQIEAATLHLASLSGLDVPEFEIHDFGSRKALLVKRFDVSEIGGRYHMISMQSLLKAHGYYFAGYDDIFNAVQKYSVRPSEDVPAFFRQMVFNAATGNTDDHLKNFCMLHKEAGFMLSPVYDILPDIHGKRFHTLSFPLGAGETAPDRSVLLKYAENRNIKNPDQILDDVIKAVSGWKEVFKNYNVPHSDIQKLEQGIAQRLDRLKG